MNAAITVLALFLGNICLLQMPGQPVQTASHPSASQASASQTSAQPRSVQQIPVAPIGAPSNAVQITNGPVVENVTDTTAEIAWSTNVNSGTALHYGTDPSHLDQTAGMPWGGFTHRVFIRDLKPNTTYYFKAESGQGQGTGTLAEAARASFQTKAAGTTSQMK
jgi:purple acid phosphatase-like protein